MLKRIIRSGALLLGGAGLWFGLAPVTTATAAITVPSCSVVDMSVGSGVCADLLTASKPSVTATVTHVNGVPVTSNTTVLRYLAPNGTRGLLAGKSYRLASNTTLLTSYIEARTGQQVWYPTTYSRGTIFHLGKDGWYHDTKTGGKVLVGTNNPPTAGETIVTSPVKIVRYLMFTGTSTATTEITVRAMAWANMPNPNGGPDCMAGGVGYGRATVTASYSGETASTYPSLSAAELALAGKATAKLATALQNMTPGDVTATKVAIAIAQTTFTCGRPHV